MSLDYHACGKGADVAFVTSFKHLTRLANGVKRKRSDIAHSARYILLVRSSPSRISLIRTRSFAAIRYAQRPTQGRLEFLLSINMGGARERPTPRGVSRPRSRKCVVSPKRRKGSRRRATQPATMLSGPRHLRLLFTGLVHHTSFRRRSTLPV